MHRTQHLVLERSDSISERLLTSDDETFEFFGFNTTYLDKGARGILGGVADLFTGL